MKKQHAHEKDDMTNTDAPKISFPARLYRMLETALDEIVRENPEGVTPRDVEGYADYLAGDCHEAFVDDLELGYLGDYEDAMRQAVVAYMRRDRNLTVARALITQGLAAVTTEASA